MTESNRIMAMTHELEILKLRAIVETMKVYEFAEIDEIPVEFMEFYEIGKKLVSLEKEMSDEYKKTAR